jgi:hypothetical protein
MRSCYFRFLKKLIYLFCTRHEIQAALSSWEISRVIADCGDAELWFKRPEVQGQGEVEGTQRISESKTGTYTPASIPAAPSLFFWCPPSAPGYPERYTAQVASDILLSLLTELLEVGAGDSGRARRPGLCFSFFFFFFFLSPLSLYYKGLKVSILGITWAHPQAPLVVEKSEARQQILPDFC